MDSIRTGFPGTAQVLRILQFPFPVSSKLRFGWPKGTGEGEKDVWISGYRTWIETPEVEERICKETNRKSTECLSFKIPLLTSASFLFVPNIYDISLW
jgi:hypothetical protein